MLQEDLDCEDIEAEMKLRATGPHIGKYRPISTSSVSNLPLEILRIIDEWVCRLDARGSVAGLSTPLPQTQSLLMIIANPLANIHISVTTFETCLTSE